MSTRRERMLKQTRASAKRRLLELWAEYVGEAEHQDDLGYWGNFESAEDAVVDFLRYCIFDFFPADFPRESSWSAGGGNPPSPDNGAPGPS